MPWAFIGLDVWVLPQLLIDLATTPPLSLSGGSVGTGGSPPQNNYVPITALIVGVLALLGSLYGAVLARRSGRDSAAAAERSAGAAELSAGAATKSAKAAEAAVELNRTTYSANAERAHAEGLAKRYQDAASQLGHDKPAVRLAGVYAMARLADDWSEERQTCVDVLCAYLRMDLKMRDYPQDEHFSVRLPDDGDMQVRRAICELISSRVTPFDMGGPWSDCDFNLRYAHLPDFVLKDARMNGTVRLTGADLVGACAFNNVYLANGLDCREITVEGTTRFRNLAFGDPNRAVVMQGAVVEENSTLILAIPAPANGRQPTFSGGDMFCKGTLTVQIGGVDYETGRIPITNLRLSSTGTFRLRRPVNDSGAHLPIVCAESWTTDDGATVDVANDLGRACFEGRGWRGEKIARFGPMYGPEFHAMGTPAPRSSSH
jgi:hypothetical protein